jgi:hypothetical protein
MRIKAHVKALMKVVSFFAYFFYQLVVRLWYRKNHIKKSHLLVL